MTTTANSLQNFFQEEEGLIKGKPTKCYDIDELPGFQHCQYHIYRMGAQIFMKDSHIYNRIKQDTHQRYYLCPALPHDQVILDNLHRRGVEPIIHYDIVNKIKEKLL